MVLGDLLAVERDEAALTFKAWAEGLPVEPRVDINPVAMLGVRLVDGTARGRARYVTGPRLRSCSRRAALNEPRRLLRFWPSRRAGVLMLAHGHPPPAFHRPRTIIAAA